jgi:hypothetical protein
VDLAIRNEELSRALVLISTIASRIAVSEAALGKVFASSRLDTLCRSIGEISRRSFKASSVPMQIEDADLEIKRKRVVYLVSELAMVGGHTRLLEDMIRLRPDLDAFVLLTNFNNRQPEGIVPDFIVNCSSSVRIAQAEILEEKLKWIQQEITSIDPVAVFLLNHHHDSVAVSAPDYQNTRTVFVHHANYTFCLGASITDCGHVDLDPRRYCACRDLGVNNSYFPSTVPDRGRRSIESVSVPESGLITCTSGTPNKFEGSYPYSYFREIVSVMQITRGKHVHIGPLHAHQIEELRSACVDVGIEIDRFIHIPWVRSVWDSLVELNVGLYISSFPVYSGRATLEALGSGTPVLVHYHRFNGWFSDIHFMYPSCLSWRTSDDLKKIVHSLDVNALRRHAQLGREWYEKHFGIEGYRLSFDDALTGSHSVQPFQPARSDPDPISELMAIGQLPQLIQMRLEMYSDLEKIGLGQAADASNNELMALDRISAEAYHRAGMKSYLSNRHQEALKFLFRSNEILPGTPQYMNSLACSLAHAGRHKEAAKWLQEALHLNPDFQVAKSNLDSILGMLGVRDSE